MVGPLGTEIEAALDDVRALYLTDLMPDTYQIERLTAVSDGRGGTTTTPAIVETGVCKLSVAGAVSTESVRASVVTGETSYVARLPLTANVLATDTLIVNGREFTVSGPPKRGGEWATTLIVELEAAS